LGTITKFDTGCQTKNHYSCCFAASMVQVSRPFEAIVEGDSHQAQRYFWSGPKHASARNTTTQACPTNDFKTPIKSTAPLVHRGQ
jgi:hypothetical protein